MRILIVSGSRADLGLLHCPEKALREDHAVTLMPMWGLGFAEAFSSVSICIKAFDMLLILGDRYEILASATAAHLQRIPIAHIGGGDVTEGSYDDAMRDCISRMASIHFTTSFASTARLVSRGYHNVHLVGNPAVDYIMHEAWQREREIAEPYVVVSYQPETIDDTVDLEAVNAAIGTHHAIWISPNPDRGSDRIARGESYSHDRFLNLLYHCDEFIGNSSAMFYEAPFLKPGGVKCKLIGKRQRGRVVPWGGDGKASERIRDVLRLWPQ
ncbi:MAG: UDP-N-acetylglucosamine 2-epimerase [Candidatus Nanopelagicales bacterium]|nr:UDP-N-acetylglucosamine 2-epimerase [Candidatus Nanopelagicales bacterium]